MVAFNWFLRAGGFTKHTTKCSRPIRPYHSASCLDPLVGDLNAELLFFFD